MAIENAINMAEVNHAVEEYLRKEQVQNPEVYSKLIIKGVNPRDIIKYIKNPEIGERWGHEYTSQVNVAIDYIYDDLIGSTTLPEVEKQTIEDVILAKVLKNASFMIFGTTKFLNKLVAMHHIVSYLQRDEKIHKWNADFLSLVQHEVIREKDYLLKESD